MDSYQQVREQAKDLVLSAGLEATFIRPRYIIGAGALLFIIPSTVVLVAVIYSRHCGKSESACIGITAKIWLVLQSAVQQPPENQYRVIEIKENWKMKN